MDETHKALRLMELIDQAIRIQRFMNFHWASEEDRSFYDTCRHEEVRDWVSIYGRPCFLDPAKDWQYVFPNHPEFMELQKEFTAKEYKADWNSEHTGNEGERAFFARVTRLFRSLVVDTVVEIKALAIDLRLVTEKEMDYVSFESVAEPERLDKIRLLVLRQRAEYLAQQPLKHSDDTSNPSALATVRVHSTTAFLPGETSRRVEELHRTEFDGSGDPAVPGTAISQTTMDLTTSDDGEAKTVRSKICKQLSEWALLAFKLVVCEGKKQTEAACEIERMRRKPTSQGQVSRWISQIDCVLSSMGMTGEQFKSNPALIPWDNRTIDLGNRQDGRHLAKDNDSDE